MHPLAIVIPAFKRDFFRTALASVAAQHDQRFTVYVGNDGGPEDLRGICDEFPDLDLVYHRFPENLGRHSLTEHWDRCVRMSREPWVWLFADDDLMEPDCVATFNQALAHALDTDCVLRFNTRIIDANGRVREESPRHPPHESGADFLFSRLQGKRQSFAVEYVFRRDAFDRNDGFPHFPVAWCSDDVAWYSFAGGSGIRTLAGPRVLWRTSDVNITGSTRSHQRDKLEAAGKFLDFIDGVVRPSPEGAAHDATEWVTASERWIVGQLRSLMPMPFPVLLVALRVARSRWRRSPAVQLIVASGWNANAALEAARLSLLHRLRG